MVVKREHKHKHGHKHKHKFKNNKTNKSGIKFNRIKKY